MDRTFTLTLSCPDRVGIVAAVSDFLASNNGWITQANHHADPISLSYFMRQEILAESLPFGLETFREKFSPIAQQFQMSWKINDSQEKKRVIVLVSKQDHCLADLLHRWRSRELEVEIPCVISNHDDLRGFVEWYGLPFYQVNMSAQSRQEGCQRIRSLFLEHGGHTLVLARFMQILTSELCQEFMGRIINIHHSFLPSFIGSKPYHQAFDRGVKLIGATCHYVTSELDGGPIIDQDVIRVNHGDSVDEMMRLGKDVEKSVLARGLLYHLQDRVLIDRNKTVVFA